MSFFDLVEKRKSVRRFLDKPIEQEKIDQILKAITLAPSAGNLQAFKVVAVKDHIKELYEAYVSPTPHENVQLVLVFLADPERSSSRYGERGETLYAIQDATIACAYAQLAATELGLGCVWVGAFDEDKIAKVLNAPGKRPVAMLPIGYPAAEPSRPPRREDIFFEESM